MILDQLARRMESKRRTSVPFNCRRNPLPNPGAEAPYKVEESDLLFPQDQFTSVELRGWSLAV
jgi:hypothetical protein